MLSTYLTEKWGLRYPIVGAPMAYAGRGRLANAVCNAGGLGMLGVGSRDSVDYLQKEAAVARGDGAGNKFGIGLMAWALEARPELLEAAIAEQPFLLSISFGSIRPYVEKAHRAGILVATQVSTRRAAVAASEAGADLIVAQGTEAGGHTGSVGTLPLLQIVLDSVKVPVAAAGGIASPSGVAAVLAAGAAAAWVGTALLLSPEADVTDEARGRLTEADETQTIHTTVFDRVNHIPWPPEFPGRALRNRFAEQWDGREEELLSNPEQIAAFRRGADAKDYDTTSIYAGQSVGMLFERMPAADVIRNLGDGAERLLRRRMRTLLDAH